MDVLRARERRVLGAAALTTGPAELVDFLLPLWAGAALGLGPTQTGALLAVELALSVVARPVAGILADRYDRRRVAAAGALLYGVSCAGYATAELVGRSGVAYGAAALGGLGGALLWVTLRAMAAERLAGDTGVLARLYAAQERGTWVAFVVGLAAFDRIDYRGAFLGAAGACLLAALALLTAPRQVVDARTREGGVRAPSGRLHRRLGPVLATVALTMAAEATVSLLLVLHLQRGLGLDVVETALVFLPGSLAGALGAGPAHRLVLRVGRRRVLAGASVASAVFAASLAWAPNAVVIAVAWVLVGAAYAAVIPVQQAVVAEVSGEGEVGRGMGLHASAALVGAMLGALAGGALYDTGSWAVACLSAAVVLLAGAVLVPRAVARVGAADVPTVVAPLDEAHADR